MGMVDLTKLHLKLMEKGTTLSAFLKRNGISVALLQIKSLGRAASTDTIEKMCAILQCQPHEIMDFGADEDKVALRGKYNANEIDLSKMWAIIADKHISMRNICIGAKININAFGNIKNGHKPQYVTLRKIARYLGVTPEDLYEIKGEKDGD